MTRLEFPDGGQAVLVEFSGEQLTLRSTVSAPPGARLSADADGGVGHVEVKVRGCRRLEETTEFLILGRFVNLARVQRERLVVED